MLTQLRLRPAVWLGLAASLSSWFIAATPIVAGPHALVPLPNPLFSIDPLSPSIPGDGLQPGDILDKPGPTAVFPAFGLGLTPLDDVDGISFNREAAVSFGQSFLLLFGVDRASVGGAAPDPFLAANNRPFNVQDQASRNQEAGDLYLSLDAFNRDGPLPFGPRITYSNNTLALNQGDTGGVDQDLDPAKAPVQEVPPEEEIDEEDGAAYPPAAMREGIVPPLFFTLTTDSPSFGSGADIYVDYDPSIPGTEMLYAQASQLHLLAADDVDALIVFDNGDFFFNYGDKVLFSLARGSPSLGQLSAADVLAYSYGDLDISVFAYAGDLGLSSTLDNLDCLELVTILLPPEDDFYDHAIFLVWPGDVDGNGILEQADCDAFADCYGIEPPPPQCSNFATAFDTDFDGDVDCNDWHEFQAIYFQANGYYCNLLSIPDFIAALLGAPNLPGHVCMADYEYDSELNGHDVRAYVTAMLGP